MPNRLGNISRGSAQYLSLGYGLCYGLLLTLVFEGIVRKMSPTSLSAVLFFLKDLLCVALIFVLFKGKLLVRIPGVIRKTILFVTIAITPLLLNTIRFEPILGFFGFKQYVLYIVAFASIPVFVGSRSDRLSLFSAVVAALALPTFAVAALQHELPAKHWLNASVDGNSLEHFAAGGQLRLSSTFSFTGQFSWFICFAFAAVLSNYYRARDKNFISRFTDWRLTVPAILFSMFLAGGRSAVFGCLVIGSVTIFLVASQKPQQMFQLIILVGVAIGVLATGRYFLPTYFAVFEARAQGYGGKTQYEELQGRILNQFIVNDNWFRDQPLDRIIFGNGLGVMSNGSQKLSRYAATIRANGMWTETDFASTLWEGGIILVIVWYGLRFFVIGFSILIWTKCRGRNVLLAAPYLSLVILFGLTGTLGIQPPIALYWWISAGMVYSYYMKTKRELKDRRTFKELVAYQAAPTSSLASASNSTIQTV